MDISGVERGKVGEITNRFQKRIKGKTFLNYICTEYTN